MIAIVADTHLPRGRRRLPPRCVELLDAAELIVHAGDVSSRAALAELETHGTVVGVHGNVDDREVRSRLPVSRELDLHGVRVGLVHDAGPARGRLARLRRRFPAVEAVIFGHSHIPLHETDPATGFQIFNPGSPTDKRRQPRFTMGLAEVRDGRIAFRLVELGTGTELAGEPEIAGGSSG